MTEPPSLHSLDWTVIVAYLILALSVGAAFRRISGTDRVSYFLANRSLPWWWAGASIAATTFAADTPLAVTGIVAAKGISGNWIWLSWLGVHAAVVVVFATRWNRSGVLTDAELIAIRYSGAPARWLRTLRACLYGIVFNCLILAWVLKAMAKIVQPFFHWERWTPGIVSRLDALWPASSAFGSPSEALTILLLLTLVGTYSSLGGIRGVMLTDLLQLVIALFGSTWLAFVAWDAVGGRTGLVEGFRTIYGPDHSYFDLFPRADSGWLSAAGIGGFAFTIYVLVQSYSNMPADGGGYLMQRLNTTRSPDDARRASALFLVLQYVVRVWPWLVVALVVLVLVPVGAEAEALNGAGLAVAGDRELAYPVIMGALLGPGILGLLVVSLLAAFMSTVDTHINWGASYMVNDVFVRLRPRATDAQQILVGRLSVIAFVVLAVLVSFRMDTIAQAWKWMATLGAALGVPTGLRWLWWRVTATAELAAIGAGLGVAVLVVAFSDLSYEQRLVATSGASVLGMLGGLWLGPGTDRAVLARFVERVEPIGVWPDTAGGPRVRSLLVHGARWTAVVGGVILILVAGQQVLLYGRLLAGTAVALVGAATAYWGCSPTQRGRVPNRGIGDR